MALTRYKTLNVFAAENRPLNLAFTNRSGDSRTPVAIDLTGSTVYFTAKVALSDLDADAVFTEVITAHTDAAGGLTVIDLDLSGEPLATFSVGRELFAEVVLKDSSGNITNQGVYKLKINPAVRRAF
tara:strand:- start:70 stop:450 length:381 start_codon:yes stop_codon:yes gene_type:complete